MLGVPHPDQSHAFSWMNAREREGLTILSRRSMLKAGCAGIGGLTLPNLLQAREEAARKGQSISSNKSVILLWMAGGPSHLDTWDPKPDRPSENRGPFDTIPTALPGVRFCEHLPKQAAMMKKFTLIRSVNATGSSHQPNQVFQTGNVLAAPRTQRKGHLYPAIGSIVGKHRGANDPALPPYVVLNLRDRTHFAWGGYLGRQHDPFVGDQVSRRLKLPTGLDVDRIQDRRTLSEAMDQLNRDVDQSGSMSALTTFEQKAFDMISGTKAREAFDVSREPQKIRDRFGDHEWAQKALLARRLVESGVSYVTVDLSNHRASGTWDTHGDKFPPYGGIVSGLKPLLPVFDHLVTTLVDDLDRRGMLDDVLVIAMGEFGRSPIMGTQGSPDGRNHWPRVMSMTMAGGGFRHGQVIGSTEPDGGEIKERPVTPGDLAATIYHHMGVPQDGTYADTQGRPHPIVENGRPIEEMI